MNININDQSSEQRVSVVVDDFCNHYDSEEQDIDFVAYTNWEDAGGISVPDDIETRACVVCQSCGAYKDEFESWNL